MPRRSNLFQEVVAIIHSQMAEGATVEESAMLVNRVTKKEQEVDVVISTDAAGHVVVVGVEASSAKRPASIEWAQRMVGKHSDLPTDKLVLVSESGFTSAARTYADAKGVLAIAPEDLATEDPAFTIVNKLPSIWPKTVTLRPEEAKIVVHRPAEGLKWFRAAPNHLIFFEDGSECGTVLDAFKGLQSANARTMFEQIGLAEIEEDTTCPFTFQVGPSWTAGVAGEEHSFFVRDDDPEPPELHLIDRLVLTGTAEIRVEEVSLTHRKLGDVMYAYGEGTVGDQNALVVFTEDAEGGKGTVRFR